MQYRVIKGELVIQGKSPDGDTVGFRLDEEHRDEWVWSGTRSGRFPQLNKGFVTNIRLEAIDALELHFVVPDVWPQVTSHQDLDLAKKARNELLTLCGFDVSLLKEDEEHRITDPAGQSISAVVAYRDIDPNGRMIGFVFKESDAPTLSTADKPEVYVKPEAFLRSVNAKLLRSGWVFPTFYGTLDHEVRDLLIEHLQQPRMDQSGVWADYKATVVLPRKPTLSQVESLILMPKVYRRLITHIAHNGAMSNLSAALSDDVVVDTKDKRLCDLGAFLMSHKDETCGDPVADQDVPYRLRLTRQPEELIFLSK